MKKKRQKNLILAIIMLMLFIVWTAAVKLIDVKASGDNGVQVGFSSINGFFHDLTGVNMLLYDITDILSVIPLGIMAVFAAYGAFQLIKRRSLLKVDKSILFLGGFYVAVMSVYVLFEIFIINYRPVLIEGAYEASYPSSTTMLVLSVMPTAIMQIRQRVKNRAAVRLFCAVIVLFSAFMVIARILSGVHWLTDIIGGFLISGALVLLFGFFISEEKTA